MDDVRHDAAALHRFIESIAQACDRTNDHPSYSGASSEFFKYIHSLAQATKSYIAQFVANLDPDLAVKDPTDFYSQAQIIRTLRLTWFNLHQFVKPALDADTLHVPYALIKTLTDRVRLLSGFEKTQFTVLHTTKLNYFQIGASDLRLFASNITKIVPSAPPFPAELGVIALPYSQASSLFLNLALAHEMAHHVFQERSVTGRVSPEIVAAVQLQRQVLPSMRLIWLGPGTESSTGFKRYIAICSRYV